MIHQGRYVIGLDYGTDSARAILVDVHTGGILATAVAAYPRWAKGMYCDASKAMFRQHPLDYVECLEKILKEVIQACPDRKAIVAIAMDTTASSPCITDSHLMPLSISDEVSGFSDDPDAMFVLWKDHTGIDEAAKINELCARRHYPYTSHAGYHYSAENFWSKVWHLFRTDERVRKAAGGVIEQCDWITSVLTGCRDIDSLRPGHCAIGAKWMWAQEWGGFPPKSFFQELDPVLLSIYDSLPKDNFGCNVKAGSLCPQWAEKLGLGTDVLVGVGNIDSYSGAVGGGVCRGTMVLNIGTSSCYMAVMPKEVFGDSIIDGVFAQVDGSIIPGQIGFEVGLSAFGDCYAWVKKLVSYSAPEEDVLARLTKDASALELSMDIPIATDYLNGRRSPATDNSLTSTLTGLRLSTTAPEIFYAYVEATAFATKAVIDHLRKGGVEIDRLVAVGGVAQKSPFVMQMLADVVGSKIEVSSCKDSCALGSAIHAAVVAGIYPTVEEAEKALCPPVSSVYVPSGSDRAIRDERYARYRELAHLD